MHFCTTGLGSIRVGEKAHGIWCENNSGVK